MTAIETGVDPFTMVARCLFDLFREFEPLQEYIKPGNFVHFAGQHTDPMLDMVADADAPELVVEPGPMQVEMWKSSTMTLVERQYHVGVLTQDLRIQKGIAPIEWLMIRALATAKSSNLGLSFVNRVMVSSYETVRDPDIDRGGREAWSGVLTVSVRMTFSQADDLLVNTPSWET